MWKFTKSGMKILMYGFGSGSNIEPWLDLLQNEDLTFICKKFSFAHPIKVVTSWWGTVLALRKRYDIVYIQGLYDWPIILFLLLFSRARVKVVQIWNNRNFRKGVLPNKKFWQVPVYRLIFLLTDRIHLEWYGIYEDFISLYPSLKKKCHVQFWGVRFVRPSMSEWTFRYIESLGNELFIFWPETMSEDEHIEVFLNAVKCLKYPVKVLLFCGSQKENAYTEKLRRMGVADIIVGNYLPYSDIMALWQRSDLSVKFSSKDSLSLGILEALYMKKPVILNDWPPYQALRDFGFRVILTELDVKSITATLNRVLSRLPSYKESGEYNRKLIIEYFDFNRNIKKMFYELSRL